MMVFAIITPLSATAAASTTAAAVAAASAGLCQRTMPYTLFLALFFAQLRLHVETFDP